MLESTTSRLLEEFRSGDRRACGRLVSVVENEGRGAAEVLSELYPLTGRAFRVGITGPPGVGKSTLVEKLARLCRDQDRSVGIVAVDPTSPFSGGAILGDRVRMPSLFTDPGVFIRSMASRGGLGGLAMRTREACDVLDAFGYDFIIIETVGVGQIELDIASTAHSTVVVLVPESGDAIQMMKAGLMEIGELFCVNKSDRQGADRLALAIESMLGLRSSQDGWKPPVVKTVGTSGEGVDALLAALERHRSYLVESDLMSARRKFRVRVEIKELVEEKLKQKIWSRPEVDARLAGLVDEVMSESSTPYRAAAALLEFIRADSREEV